MNRIEMQQKARDRLTEKIDPTKLAKEAARQREIYHEHMRERAEKAAETRRKNKAEKDKKN